tara:strand:+ start:345 stop:1364 length:1020 start_codon:yes stop_codon:yes gene_type:complete
MASTYSELKFELITTGEQAGTWGVTTDTNIGTAIQEAITGSADVAYSSAADVTVTLTDTNATQTARNLRLNLTESGAGIGYTGNLILGSGCQIEKLYIINNGTTATKTVKNTTGTGIAVPAGKTMFVFNNGTNVVDATTYLSSLTLGTDLAVADGGTGASTFSSGALLKGAGTSPITTATVGTDYVAPGTATTFTALQTFAGTSSNADLKTSNILEVATVSATAATGTIAYDVTTQSVLYYTSNASANWTVNFRGSSGTSLNTIMATGESLSVTFLVTQGSTAYYNSAVQVDGSSVTPKWQGGTAPTTGNASSIDSYTYVIIKTGSAAFTVLATQTKFS